MAENKTVETKASVKKFLNAVTDETKRKDSFRLVEIMQEHSGYEPKMWGPAIVGFGSYHYRYESGREGDAPVAAFSPRKKELTIYLATNYPERDKLLKEFGKHTSSKACIYVKKLSDINESVLKKMVQASVKYMKSNYDVRK